MEKRTEERIVVPEIPVVLIDKERLHSFNATLIDFSKSGCGIISDDIRDLPKDIGLQIHGLDLTINGDVAWRKEKVGRIGLKFQWEEIKKRNKRREKRFKVSIPAMISKYRDDYSFSCVIRATAMSGCSIVADNLDQFMDTVFLQVSGMATAVKGKIVERKGNTARVKLLWFAESLSSPKSAPISEEALESRDVSEIALL